MKITNYGRIALFEGLLLSLLSTCTAVSLEEGFFIPENWNGTLFPALPVCIFTTIYWILISYNRRTSLIGGIGFLFAGAAGIVLLAVSSDKQSRILLYLIVAVLASTILFLISRARIGCGVLIAGGCLVLCGNAFLQYGSHPVFLCLYMPVSLILLIERSYRIRIRKVSTFSPSVLRHTTSGILCCLLSLVLTGLLLCLILPAHLPTQELKLIRELVRMPIMEKIGTASTISLQDPDRFSDKENGKKDPTSQEGENATDSNPSEEMKDADSQSQKDPQELLNAGKEQKTRAISYHRRKYSFLLIPLLPVLFLTAAVFLKKRHRRIRLQRYDELDPPLRAAAYYQYFLHMLSLIHLEDISSETVREYNRKVKKRIRILFPEPEQFVRLSRDFERVYYGEEDLTKEEWEQFRRISLELPSLCCSSVGKIRYLLIFFRT